MPLATESPLPVKVYEPSIVTKLAEKLAKALKLIVVGLLAGSVETGGK